LSSRPGGRSTGEGTVITGVIPYRRWRQIAGRRSARTHAARVGGRRRRRHPHPPRAGRALVANGTPIGGPERPPSTGGRTTFRGTTALGRTGSIACRPKPRRAPETKLSPLQDRPRSDEKPVDRAVFEAFGTSRRERRETSSSLRTARPIPFVRSFHLRRSLEVFRVPREGRTNGTGLIVRGSRDPSHAHRSHHRGAARRGHARFDHRGHRADTVRPSVAHASPPGVDPGSPGARQRAGFAGFGR